MFVYHTPLKSLVNGIIVSKNTFQKMICELEDFYQNRLDTCLDAIIGHALFPKYLKYERVIN